MPIIGSQQEAIFRCRWADYDHLIDTIPDIVFSLWNVAKSPKCRQKSRHKKS